MDPAKIQFAEWLATVHPNLFQAVYQRALGQPITAPGPKGSLGGLTDFLSNVGTTLADAASSVGSFLTSKEGLATLSTLGTAYLTTRAQNNVLDTQIARANAGQPPAPIQYATDSAGNLVPIMGSGVATTQVTPQVLNALRPETFLSKYGWWIAAGVVGAIGLGIFFFKQRR